MTATKGRRLTLALGLVLVVGAAVFLVVRSTAHVMAAEREGRAWLDAFNAADGAALDRFNAERFPSHPPEVTTERLLGVRDATGGFELRKVESSTPERFSALVEERASEQFARMTVEVEASEPHLVTKLGVQAIPRPAEFAIAPLTDDELGAALRAKLDGDARAETFAGAVLVVHRGKTVLGAAYGLADHERRIPNRVDTRFRIGSMNKMFTATAILQLVQAGSIQLGDPLGKSLPDYPDRETATKVTIHHLLTHTGGTGDIFGPEFDARRTELRTLDDYVTLYGARPPAFEPGSRWAYSNYGMLLLGVLIEKVSGQSYYDYVRDHVYGPAGMTRSGSEPEDAAVEDRVVGYMKSGGGWRPSTDTLPYRGTSAGGGYSTVEDLARFAAALTANRLLDAEHTELLTSGKVETPDGGKYAYGFEDSTGTAGRSFGHGGGAPGMNGELRVFPRSGYVVAVLSNLDPPAASRVSQYIVNRLGAR